MTAAIFLYVFMGYVIFKMFEILHLLIFCSKERKHHFHIRNLSVCKFNRLITDSIQFINKTIIKRSELIYIKYAKMPKISSI